jgi:hypothetical protein
MEEAWDSLDYNSFQEDIPDDVSLLLGMDEDEV